MIIFDTEATALHDFALAPLDHQPELLEFYGVKYPGSDLKGAGTVCHFLCKPRAGVISEEVTKITGLKWTDVEDAKGFPGHYAQLCDFFLGETTVVAHNAPYDMGVLRCELMRMGKEFAFPWPRQQLCTVELSQGLSPNGKFLKLTELYQILFKKDFDQKHRAASDTTALVAVVREMKKRGLWPKT